MIIDFRVRPPFKSFLTLRHFKSMSPKGDVAEESILSLGRQYIPSAAQRSIGLFMREMDEAGINMACVMGRTNDRDPETPPTSNDDTAELARLYPDRLIPFAALNPLSENAISELERTVGGMNFKGISMDLGNCEMYADAPRLDPIYKKAEEFKCIVSLTTSMYLGSDLSFSDPVHIQRTANRFPGVTFVVPHACWPYIDQALALPVVCPNVYLIPDFYLAIPNMPSADNILRAANSYLQRRILFASGYPFRGLKQSVTEWSDKAWEKNALQDSLYYNAARILKL